MLSTTTDSDVLETIEVDEQHCQPRFTTLGFFDGRRQMGGEEQPVWQSGQLVVVALVRGPPV